MSGAVTGGLVDQAARARALDPHGSFIVQAPAGAGKTELLTQRVLVLLAQVQQPQEIVAITFTRKAAGEMRQRVLAALRSGQGALPDTPHKQTTWRLARAALARDAELGWNLLNDPTQLWVTTFDSLNQSLVQRMPVRSLLGGEIAITENPEPLYRASARALLQQISQEQPAEAPISIVLAMLDNQFAQAEDLLVEMLARRDHWLERLVSQRDALLDDSGRLRLEQTLQRLIEDVLQRAAPLFAVQAAEWLRFVRITQAQKVVGLTAELAAEKDPRQMREWTVLPSAEAGAVEDWRALANWLLVKDEPKLRTGWNKNDGVLAPGEPKGKAHESERAQRKAFKDALLERVATLQGQEALLQDIRSLPPARLSDENWQQIRALLQLLQDAVSDLLLRFAERGEADFSELARRAREALGSEDEPTDLALHLDARIRHVLVDEFQDTSQGQFRFLQRLIAGWQYDSAAHSLFLVGDPMQSIYRFRDAEVSLFLEVQHAAALNAFPLESLQLQVNFRSRPAVVDWNNACFSRIFTRPDGFTGAVAYAHSAAARAAQPGRGGVQLHALAKGDDGRLREAQRVLALVREALADVESGALKSIAILVRGRGHLLEIVQTLRDAGINYRAVELESLADRPLVRDLDALTRALLHPAAHEAWLAVLRAPFCGLSLVDLEILFKDAPRAAHVPALLRARAAQLSGDAQGRIAALLQVLERGRRVREGSSLREWVERVWLALGGAAVLGCAAELGSTAELRDLAALRLDEASALEDVEAYLQLLEQQRDGEDIADFAALRERTQTLRARSSVSAPLQIMTMHKAKGLEFDVVILPALERTPPPSKEKLLEWLEIPRSDGRGVDPLLVPKRAVGVSDDPLYAFTRRIDHDRERNEQLRLLYVACTRARERLHLLAQVDAEKDPASSSLLARLWPALEADWRADWHAQGLAVAQGAAAADSAAARGEGLTEAVAAPSGPLLTRVRQPWTPAQAQHLAPDLLGVARSVAPPLEFSWASRDAAHIGTVTHALLEQISRQGLSFAAQEAKRSEVAQWRAWVQRRLQQAGLAQASLATAAARVWQAVQAAMTGERGRWVLQHHEEDRWEWALSGWVAEPGADPKQGDVVQPKQGKVVQPKQGKVVQPKQGKVVQRLVQGTLDRSFIADGVRWIIDYKTASHEGADRAHFLDEEQARYRAQLEAYARLVRALDQAEGRTLPIRLALYFPMLDAWREWEPPSDGATC